MRQPWVAGLATRLLCQAAFVLVCGGVCKLTADYGPTVWEWARSESGLDLDLPDLPAEARVLSSDSHDSHATTTTDPHHDTEDHSDCGDSHSSSDSNHSEEHHDCNTTTLTTTVVHHSSHEEHAEHESHQQDVLFYLFNAIVLGTAVVHMTSYIHQLSGVQPTVAIFVLGMIYAAIIEGASLQETSGVLGRSYVMWMGIDPHLLLFTLLPVLLTGDAMTIDTSVARSVAKQCLYLAGPGVLVNTFLSALFLWAYLPYGWSFLLCLTTGAILAATDPVAVVSLLKELGASPILTVQIQGESLLNDGTAIVLYTVAYDMLKGKAYSAKDIALFMVKVALCAFFLGTFIGGIFSSWIRQASDRLQHSSILIQISLTLCCAYVSWFLAEGVLKISGVLSTVAAALVLADNMWSAIVSKEALHEVWHMLEYFGNTTIFFLAGSLISQSMFQITFPDYLHLFYIYIVLTLIRALMLFVSRPLLQFLSPERRPVSIADTVVMTWGGLRGAVGLALAITVQIDRAGGTLDELTCARVLFYVGGVAALTLLVNATTCPALVNWLGITQTSTTKKHILLNIHDRLKSLMAEKNPSLAVKAVLEKKLEDMVEDIFPNGVPKVQRKMADKNSLRSAIGAALDGAKDMITSEAQHTCTVSGTELVEQLEHSKDIRQKTEEFIPLLGTIPEPILLAQEEDMKKVVAMTVPDLGLQKALNEAFLSLVRSQYWEQIENGYFVPGTATADRLLNSISNALHNPEILNDLAFIEKDMGLKHLLEKRVNQFNILPPQSRIGKFFSKLYSYMPEPAKNNIKAAHTLMLKPSQSRVGEEKPSAIANVVRSNTFFCGMMVVIIVNTVLILVEDDSQMKDSVPWLVTDVLFTAIFITEFILKFYVMRLQYFSDGWNSMDFMCVILAMLGLQFRILVFAGITDSEVAPSEADVLRLNRIFRVMRLMRASELIRIFRVARAQYLRKTVSPTLANSLDIIESMKAFAVAHIHSHTEFFRYFGEEGTLSSPEEIRVILDSRTSINIALARAAHEASKLDKEPLIGLNVLWESSQVTEELSQFVLSALQAGIINHQEAESIIHPLKHHGHHAMTVFADSHLGIQDESLSYYHNLVEEANAAALRERVASRNASLALSQAGAMELAHAVQDKVPHMSSICDAPDIPALANGHDSGKDDGEMSGDDVDEEAKRESGSFPHPHIPGSVVSEAEDEAEAERRKVVESGPPVLQLMSDLVGAVKVEKGSLNSDERERLRLDTKMVIKLLAVAKIKAANTGVPGTCEDGPDDDDGDDDVAVVPRNGGAEPEVLYV